MVHFMQRSVRFVLILPVVAAGQTKPIDLLCSKSVPSCRTANRTTAGTVRIRLPSSFRSVVWHRLPGPFHPDRRCSRRDSTGNFRSRRCYRTATEEWLRRSLRSAGHMWPRFPILCMNWFKIQSLSSTVQLQLAYVFEKRNSKVHNFHVLYA